VKFSTYAYNWIRSTMGAGLQQRGRAIRLPDHALDSGPRIVASLDQPVGEDGVLGDRFEHVEGEDPGDRAARGRRSPRRPRARRARSGPAAASLALGVVATGIAYLLYFGLIAGAGPSTAILVTYLVPATVLVYAATLPDEVGGLALVLGGVALGTGAVRRRQPATVRP
jgi:hypothetical protein